MGLTSTSLRNKESDDTATGAEGSDGVGATSTCGSNNNNNDNDNNNNNQGAREACKLTNVDNSKNSVNDLEQGFTPLKEGDLIHGYTILRV